MKSRTLPLSIYVVIFVLLSGCNANDDTAINYFNQTFTGPDAELFAPDVVSTKANEHSGLSFAPDGSVVLWSIMDNHFKGRIYEMNYSDGKWSAPSTPSFADTLYDYYSPSFSPDGKFLLFSSGRKADGYPEGRGNRIWFVERTPNGWETPVPFDTIVSKSSEFSHSISNDGTIYFSTATESNGTSLNISRAEKNNGAYVTPKLLPYSINTSGYEDGPYISPDEDYMIFESTRAEGIAGSHDLYITFRNDNDQWSIPVNMGPKINSAGMERFPRVSPDGKYLFFASNRNQSADRVGFDFYWIDTKVIDELRTKENTSGKIDLSLGNTILESIHQNDSSRLEKSLIQWLRTYPSSIDARVMYSTALRSQKRFAKAERLMTDPVLSANKNTSTIIETALVKYGLNKDDEAIQLLAPVFANDIDVRHRYLVLSNALFDMEKYDLSDGYFERAMAIQGSGGEYYNRACGYAHRGETKRVFAHLNKAADLGFNSKQQYENDPDLTTYKSYKQFTTLLHKLK